MRFKTRKEKPSDLAPNNSTLKRIISGGQPGAELAGLKAAKEVGYKTGGHMPFFFEATEDGHYPLYKPGYNWKYGVIDDCPSEEIGVYTNVREADATIRLALCFDTFHEYQVLKAIRRYSKPHLDVYLEPTWYAGNGDWELRIEPTEIAAWLEANKVQTLNISGNCNLNVEAPAYFILLDALNILRWE